MPVLDVEIVVRPGEVIPEDLATRLAHRAGEVLGAAPGTTWVKLHLLAAGHYAENDAPGADPMYPVFVHVLKAQWPETSELRREVAALTSAVAEICARPAGNVHIVYQPPAAGRVAFGGRIVGD